MAITTGARRNGKTAAMLRDIRERLAGGEHVHVARNAGTICLNGPAACTVPRRTIAQLERELKP